MSYNTKQLIEALDTVYAAVSNLHDTLDGLTDEDSAQLLGVPILHDDEHVTDYTAMMLRVLVAVASRVYDTHNQTPIDVREYGALILGGSDE